MKDFEYFTREDSFGAFLNRIGKYRVLTRTEEYALGSTIQSYIQLEEDLAQHPELKTRKEQCEYLGITSTVLHKLKRDCDAAKETLIKHNIRLVVHIAKRYQNRGISTEDLVQEGTIGLHRAAEKFNPEKGYKFSTYSYWWIRQAISKVLTCNSRTIRLPPDIYKLIDEVKVVSERIKHTEGRVPTIDEIAISLKRDPNRVYQALMCCKRFISLETLQIHTDKDEGGGYHTSYQINYEESDSLAVSPEDFTEDMLEGLTLEQQYILIRKFGLDGGKPATYRKISEDLGITINNLRKQRDLAFRQIKGQLVDNLD